MPGADGGGPLRRTHGVHGMAETRRHAGAAASGRAARRRGSCVRVAHPPGEFDRFTDSFVAAYRGSKSKQGRVPGDARRMVRLFPGSPSRRAARFRSLPICGKRRASGTDVSNRARPPLQTPAHRPHRSRCRLRTRPRSRPAFLMTGSASGATAHRSRPNPRPKQSIEHEPAFRSAPRFARRRVARRRMSRGTRRVIEFKICLVILAICPSILHQIRA